MAALPNPIEQFVTMVERTLLNMTLDAQSARRIQAAVSRATAPGIGALSPGTVVNVPGRIARVENFYAQNDPPPMTAEAIRRAREQWEAMHEQMRVAAQEHYLVHPNMLDELRRALGGAGAGLAEHFDTVAIDRARSLLRRNLTTQQRKSVDRYGSFVVIGNQSHAHYTIKNTGRVIRQTDQHEFCLQVVGEPVPVEDAMLARKCLIESNEELFLSTANDLTEPRGAANSARAEMEEYRRWAQEEAFARQRRLAEREAWHRAQAALATRPEIPDPSFTDRLRALVARNRG